jgi:hypothetical protein
MTKLYNPTNSEVNLVFQGVPFSILAMGTSEELQPEVAEYWTTRIHEFLQVVSETPVKKTTKTKEPVIETGE